VHSSQEWAQDKGLCLGPIDNNLAKIMMMMPEEPTASREEEVSASLP